MVTMKRKERDPIVHVASSLYDRTAPNDLKPSEGQRQEIQEKLTEKYLPYTMQWYPVYLVHKNLYQMDLMFEPYTNAKGEQLMQAILVQYEKRVCPRCRLRT